MDCNEQSKCKYIKAPVGIMGLVIVNVFISPQIPWYCRRSGNPASLLGVASYDHAYIVTDKEVLLILFSQRCYLQSREDEK